MRVTLLSKTTGWGGTEVFAAALASALHQRNHDVTVVSLDEAVLSERKLPAGVKARHTPVTSGLGVRARCQTHRAIVRGLPSDVGVLIKGWFRTGDWSLDLLARRYWSRYYVVEQLACAPVARPHRSIRVARCAVPADLRWWKAWLSGAVRAYLAHKTVAVGVTVANRLRERYMYPRGRIVVLPNGADPARFRRRRSRRSRIRAEWGIQKHEFVFGVASRLKRVKRVDLTIQAFQRLCEGPAARERIRLVIAGDGPEQDLLHRLVHELRMGDRVTFLPFTSEPESLYCAMDCFVLASENEGLPLSLCEAMATQVLPIATDAGGSGEVIHDPSVGRLIPSGDLDALVEAMSWAMNLDHPTRESIGRNARERIVDHYQLDVQIAGMVTLIETGRCH